MDNTLDKLRAIKGTVKSPLQQIQVKPVQRPMPQQFRPAPIAIPKRVVNEQVVRRTFDPSRVPTGIRGFDQLIGGGFKRGSVNLLSGGPGTGKTIFAMEFLLNGIVLSNEGGIFISFDEKKDSVYENMKSLGWDLDKIEKTGKFTFVEYTPEQLMKILAEGGGLLDNLMSKAQARRLVIDSISTFLLISSSEFGKREQLTNFFKLLKKWEVTTLLTNEYTPISGNEISKETLSINFEVDSIIQLYYVHDSIGTERRRLVEVYKMRGTKHYSRAVLYEITQRGIEIFLQ